MVGPDRPGRSGPAGDAAVAAAVARAVGELLLRLREDPPPGGADRLRAAADRAADDLAHRLLAEFAAGDLVLSEESPDPAARLRADRVWIVDPLDGTREYGEPGRSDWAVHVALWSAGDLSAGAVALPATGVLLATAPAPGLPERAAVPRVVVSRTRPPSLAAALTRFLGGRLVRLGSTGAKVAAVVRGEAEVYVETGGLHEWDAAAPVAVARAAGLAVTGTDGSPVLFNQPDPRRTGLVVARPDLLDAVLDALSGAVAPAADG